MKTVKITVIFVLFLFSFNFFVFPEIVEEIYAIVNGEVITYSELKNSELELTKMLQQRYQGKELQDMLDQMKKSLLDRIIDQKVVLSRAKEKNYNVEQDIDAVIAEIKKQNNLTSTEQLRQALIREGINFPEWKKQIGEQRIQARLIYEEIGSKIKISNSEIMAYYKKNLKQFTSPMEITLNCIFLDRTNYVSESTMKDKMDKISAELKKSGFEKTAKLYSELPGSDQGNISLGKFKQGELNKDIEEAALKLKKDEISDWIKTENGNYIIQVAELSPAKASPYKDVSNNIKRILTNQIQEKQLVSYVKKLKEESYIKILKEYN